LNLKYTHIVKMVVNVKVPEQQLTPLTPGSSNPQQSAAMKISNMNEQQVAVSKIGGIGKKRRGIGKKRGGASIEVQPTNTSSMNVNGLVAKVATNDVNSQANAEFDKGAFKGGRTRRRTKRRIKKTRVRRHKKTRR